MLQNKDKFKLYLFKKYGIKLGDDDPFWLLMLMQKDMSSEIVSVTKKAQKTITGVVNLGLYTKIFLFAGGVLIGIVLASLMIKGILIYNNKKYTNNQQNTEKVVYKEKILYASDKKSLLKYTSDQLSNLPKKLLPDSYYYTTQSGDNYIKISTKDSRIVESKQYYYIKINSIE